MGDVKKHSELRNRLLMLATKGMRSDRENKEFLESFRLIGAEGSHNLARENKIEALVGTVLQDLAGSDALSESWIEIISDNEKRVRRLLQVVGTETKTLEHVGIPHAAVESAGVMLGSDLPFSALGSGDIDILVSKDGFAEAVKIFETAGFHGDNRRDRPTARVEMKRVEDDGIVLWINIFSSPFDRMWVPLIWSDQSNSWLRRREGSRRWPGINVLKADDALAFVSMHTSLHSYIRSPGLRLHVDVDRLVRDNDIDWDSYVAQIKAMNVPKRAFFSIELARELLGTPIPDHVLDALAPSKFVRKSVRSILDRNGLIADGRPKLTRWQTPLLDILLHERGFFSWLRSVVVPPEAWMREHFGRNSGEHQKLSRLHMKRFRMLLLAWNPK